jgi:hypothetical protein
MRVPDVTVRVRVRRVTGDLCGLSVEIPTDTGTIDQA